MSMKTVYLFDESSFLFAGMYDAQESPLEPGVFIAPICSTEVMPPDEVPGTTTTWNGTQWVQTAIPQEVPLPVVEFPITLTALQFRKALAGRGLRVGVEDFIRAGTTASDYSLKDLWEFTSQFSSTDAFTLQLAQGLRLHPEDVTALFKLGATL